MKMFMKGLPLEDIFKPTHASAMWGVVGATFHAREITYTKFLREEKALAVQGRERRPRKLQIGKWTSEEKSGVRSE